MVTVCQVSAQIPPAASHRSKSQPLAMACKAPKTWPLVTSLPSYSNPFLHSLPGPFLPQGLCTAVPSAQNAGLWTFPWLALCLLSRLWLYCLLGKDFLFIVCEQNFPTPSLFSALFFFITIINTRHVCICHLLPVECLLHWIRTWLCSLCLELGPGAFLLHCKEQEMETTAWQEPLLSPRPCSVSSSQVGLPEAK